MTPDYEHAALMATETLLTYHVSTAPIMPLPILKTMPGVLVLSFAEMARNMGIDRKNVIGMFGEENQDAVTIVEKRGAKLRYIVAYNQRLPFYMCQRSLARELGHIVMQHDGSKPQDVRIEEALCFSMYLLFPRPLLYAVKQAGIPLTIENVGNMTGCYERCLRILQKMPGIPISANLNLAVKKNFADYIQNYLDYQSILAATDESPIADLGTYMDNYIE